jgi:hypothetical protein
VLVEHNYGGQELPYLPERMDFKNGKLYPNDRPGLRVTVALKQCKLLTEIDKPVTARAQTE